MTLHIHTQGDLKKCQELQGSSCIQGDGNSTKNEIGQSELEVLREGLV
jgi:hypothetical protein